MKTLLTHPAFLIVSAILLTTLGFIIGLGTGYRVTGDALTTIHSAGQQTKILTYSQALAVIAEDLAIKSDEPTNATNMLRSLLDHLRLEQDYLIRLGLDERYFTESNRSISKALELLPTPTPVGVPPSPRRKIIIPPKTEQDAAANP